jgi:uncharacterized protein (TIGR02996 family)
MTVWFCHRSHYDLPATRFVKSFDDPNLLEWFRKHCPPIPDAEEAEAHARRLGIPPRYFAHYLNQYAESDLPPPRNDQELRAILERWSVEGEILFQRGAIQILDDDDELQFASYIFDDAFAKRHPERTAWLTQPDWRLPEEMGKGGFRSRYRTCRVVPRGRWEGTTYFVCLAYYDSGNLDDLSGASRLDGVRLPQLARYLAAVPAAARERAEGWAPELAHIAEELFTRRAGDAAERAFLRALREAPGEGATWEVYGDWLEERGRPRADLWLLEGALERASKAKPGRHSGDIKPRRPRNRSEWHVGDHTAQLCLHTATYNWPHRGCACFVHWALFDDLWASAHPDLANSLLAQAARWDVLSSPRRPSTD